MTPKLYLMVINDPKFADSHFGPTHFGQRHFGSDISAPWTFRPRDVSAPWTFRPQNFSAPGTFQPQNFSAPWMFWPLEHFGPSTFQSPEVSVPEMLFGLNINWCNKGLVSTIICDIIVTMQYYFEIAAYKQAAIMRSEAYTNTSCKN